MGEYNDGNEELNLWAQFAMLLMFKLKNNTEDNKNKEIENNAKEKEKR